MKNLQRLSAVAALTLMFTLPALAGEMDTGVGVAPPSPPTTSSTTQGGANGHIPTGPSMTTERESFSEVVWGVLEGVWALF